jgi:hypothetical protein
VEREIAPSGIRLMSEDDRPMLNTEYFPDGSAIVVTERGILLLGPVAKYEVKSSTQESK